MTPIEEKVALENLRDFANKRFKDKKVLEWNQDDLIELMQYHYKSKVEAISDECKWSMDEDYEYYETECSGDYAFIDGGVKENNYKYCPFCGKEIKEV